MRGATIIYTHSIFANEAAAKDFIVSLGDDGKVILGELRTYRVEIGGNGKAIVALDIDGEFSMYV